MKTMRYRSLCRREAWMSDAEWAYALAFVRAFEHTARERCVRPSLFLAERLSDAVIAHLLVRRAEAALLQNGDATEAAQAAPEVPGARRVLPPVPAASPAELEAIFQARGHLRKSLAELEAHLDKAAPPQPADTAAPSPAPQPDAVEATLETPTQASPAPDAPDAPAVPAASAPRKGIPPALPKAPPPSDPPRKSNRPDPAAWPDRSPPPRYVALC